MTKLLRDWEAAELLGVSRSTLWRQAKIGIIPAPIRIGGTTRWRLDELLDAVEQASAQR